MRASSASHSSPTSRVTASKTTDGGPARATRVATRRNADCSSDSRADLRASRRNRAASSPTTTAVTRKTPNTTTFCDSVTWSEWVGIRNR
jgi:hypothetical protein